MRKLKLEFFARTATMLLMLLATTATAWAQNTYSVSAWGNQFTIQRSNSERSETVYYRTVSLTAVEGINYTGASGTVTFGVGEHGKTITVTEKDRDNLSGLYFCQTTGTSRSYRFEVLNSGGFLLDSRDRDISYVKNNETDDVCLVKSTLYNSLEQTVSTYDSEVKVTDSNKGYDQDLDGVIHIVSASEYFKNRAPRAYFQATNAELRMTVSLQAKEKDDGYQYIQIATGIGTTDNIDKASTGNGEPGTPQNSLYMAGFEHGSGGKETSYAKYSFPVTTVANNSGSNGAKPWSGNTVGILCMQRFQSSNVRATDGRLIIPNDFDRIRLYFDASGNNEDDWYFKNAKTQIQAIDVANPTLKNVKVNSGMHAKGNTFMVSLVFSEIVTTSSANRLGSSWGQLDYVTGSGTNVLTFQGTIPNSASGPLNITTLSHQVKDLSSKSLSGSVASNGLCNLDTDHTFSIEYDLNGGTLATANPTSFTYSTNDFTLTNPTRLGYSFTGWTGTGLNEPTLNVTVAKGTSSDLFFTANWTDVWGMAKGADGSANHPYIIRNRAGWKVLTELSASNSFANTYFRLEGNISGVETMVGDNVSYPFCGIIDGNGHQINLALNLEEAPAGTGTTESLQGLALVHHAGNGCTISNLAVGGTIQTACKFAAGFISYINSGADGSSNVVTLTNCRSSVTITSSVSGDATSAGFVAISRNNVNLSLTGCIFDGAFISTAGTQFCGMVGWQASPGPTTISNCAVTPAATMNLGTNTGHYTFCRYGSSALTLSGYNYYSQAIGTAQGTIVYYADLNECVAAVRTGGTTIAASHGEIYADGVACDSNEYYTPDATVTVGPADGYVVTSVSYNDGTDHTLNAVDNTWSFTMPAKDVTVTGTGTVIEYTISYNLDGGSLTTANPTVYTVESESFVLTNPTREGSTFAGWTGTGLSNPTKTVVIAKGSTGDRSYTATWTNERWNGRGTEQYPFIIANKGNLESLAQLVSGIDCAPTDYEGAFFRLDADIDMAGINFEGIGTIVSGEERPFKATFDGNGHTISNLNIDRADENYKALFGWVGEHGTVKNLILADATIKGYYNTGALVAELDKGTVENCVVRNCTVEACHFRVGAIACVFKGYVRNLIVTDSRFTGTDAAAIASMLDFGSYYDESDLPNYLGMNYYNNCIAGRNSTTYKTSHIGFSSNNSINFKLSDDDNIRCKGANTVLLPQSGITVLEGQRKTGTPNAVGVTIFDDGFTFGGKQYYTEGSSVTLQYYTISNSNSTYKREKTITIYANDVLPLMDDFNNAVTIAAADLSKTYDAYLLNRTLYRDGEWNTLCLPFDLSDSQIAKSKLANSDIRTLESSDFSRGVLSLNFSSGNLNSITAGTPYIIKLLLDASNVSYEGISGSSGFDDSNRHAQNYKNLIDGDSGTKWCAGTSHQTNGAWVCEFSSSVPVNVTGYTLTTGNDTGSGDYGYRNPKVWTLEARASSGDSWTTIDSRDVNNESGDALPVADFADKTYDIAANNQGTYQYFRFTVSATGGNGNEMQLAELKLEGTCTATTVDDLFFPDITVSTDINDITTDKVSFKGNYTKMNYAAEDRSILFLGGESTLFYPLTGASIGAQRAYFQLNGIEAGDISTARLFLGDSSYETGMTTTDFSDSANKTDAWYDLKGRKLDKQPTHKGLYIHNGRKVVMK